MNFHGKFDARSVAAAVPGRHSSRSSHGLRLRLYAVLLTLDASAIVIAFAIGTLIRFGTLQHDTTLDIAFATLPLFFGTALNSGAYSLFVLRKARTGMVHAFSALLFAYGSLVFISYYLRVNIQVSRLSVGAGMAISFVLVMVFRSLFGRVVRRFWANSVTCEIAIMDGVSVPVPSHFIVLHAEERNLRPNYRDPMMLDRLAMHLKGADRVVVACRPEDERAWAMLLKGANIRGEIVANEFDAVGAFAIDALCDRTTLVVASGPLNVRDRVFKRLFDLLVAVPALLLLAPVFILTAIAIKIDSRGPIFFLQQRVGRGNALFKIYKFRSMRDDRSDHGGAQSASRDDDRITLVGRFIRRTSIDELPQLLNVLFGSMSIVGPRPHALGSMAGQRLFWDVDERYWHRHALKPGITGLAQVRGFRGATLRTDDLTRRLQADLEYISGWSVWRDFGILLSTIRVVVHHNAY